MQVFCVTLGSWDGSLIPERDGRCTSDSVVCDLVTSAVSWTVHSAESLQADAPKVVPALSTHACHSACGPPPPHPTTHKQAPRPTQPSPGLAPWRFDFDVSFPIAYTYKNGSRRPPGYITSARTRSAPRAPPSGKNTPRNGTSTPRPIASAVAGGEAREGPRSGRVSEGGRLPGGGLGAGLRL